MHISMSVLIGVGGEPTLGQHQYNRAYSQTPGRYMCNTKNIYYKLFKYL